MNQAYDRAQLKSAARAAMRQTKPRVWLVTLVSQLLVGAVSGIASTLLIMGSVTSFVQQMSIYGIYDFRAYLPLLSAIPLLLLFALLTGVFSTLISYGYNAYALKVWRGQPAGFGDLFSMFPRFLRVIGSGFMVGLFVMLWSLLVYVPVGVLSVIISMFGHSGVWSLLLSLANIAASIFTVWVSLRYAMTPYWIITDADCGIMESIRRSKEYMRGNYVRLFILELSFFGWYLLVGLIVGVFVIVGAVIGVATAAGMLQGGYGYYGVYAMEATFAIVGYVLLFSGIGALLSIPLNLFLTGYVTVSQMGFFDLLAGGAATETGDAPPPSSGTPESDWHIPPISAPPTYTPPVYTSPAYTPPAAPAPVDATPVVETPVVAEPVVEAPVVEPPVVEAPAKPAEPADAPSAPGVDDEDWNLK